jgi:S-adenosylmethionine decarboxylase proenzyme
MTDRGSDTPNQNGDEPNPRTEFIVMVSAKFIVLGLLSCMLLAFSVGRAARIILIEGPRQALLAPHDQSTLRNRPDYHEGYARSDSTLPPPIARRGKEVPKTVYTSKNFDTARSATSSSLLIRRSEDGDEEELEQLDHVCVSREDGTKQCSRSRAPTSDGDEEEHLPAGQHLLVDMVNVDGDFLNSEERLATAMIKVVDEASLTLLSYHCHTLLPAGVSCVGVLLESHVSFHTWPTENVITLDLFTCGSAPLVPVVPIIERLFGVPQENSEPNRTAVPVRTKWAHKLRGFRQQNSSPLQAWDLGVHILGDIDLEMKSSVRLFYRHSSFGRFSPTATHSLLWFNRLCQCSRSTSKSILSTL